MCLADCGSDFDLESELSVNRWSSDLPDPSDMACDDDAPPCDDAPYLHPLQGMELVDGQLPFFDLHESPVGKAYAIMEGGGQAEGQGETYRVGGVVELEHEFLSEAELAERFPDKEPRLVPGVTIAKVEPKLQGMIDAAEEGEVLKGVIVMLEPPDEIEGTLTDEIERAIARGEISTEHDYEVVRQQKLAGRRDRFLEASGPVVEALADLGLDPTLVCEHMACVIADLSAADVVALSERDDVVRVGSPIGEPSPGSVTGRQRQEAYQADLFWDKPVMCGSSIRSYDGDRACSQNIHVAVADNDRFLLDHVAFKNGATGSRVVESWECSPSTCSPATWSPPPGIGSSHGTQTLGTLFGDYRDGQDPSISTAARLDRSATAGESKAFLYAYFGLNAYVPFMLSVLNRSPEPGVLVESQGGFASNCSGEEFQDSFANLPYENGIPYFVLAGNDGLPGAANRGNASDCSVWVPGAAIGVFTVGAYDEGAGSACDTETAAAHDQTAWGGATAGPSSGWGEGKRRSIIDLAGAWGHGFVPTNGGPTNTSSFTGTSAATPSVASVAVGVIDMFKTSLGTSFIDNPGVLYAWMLNMGDRARSDTSGKRTARFDHRLGAGRIGARFLSGEGMDAPWIWEHYALCVADNQVVDIDLGALSSDYDAFRAVAWWYDSRHNSSGGSIDDFDLRLVNLDSGGTMNKSDDSYDNKERIYHGSVGSKDIRLEVVGSDVTADTAGCGTNRMKVFVTILVEDSDRDDANGPSYNPTTCEGVETL